MGRTVRGGVEGRVTKLRYEVQQPVCPIGRSVGGLGFASLVSSRYVSRHPRRSRVTIKIIIINHSDQF